MLPSNMIGYKFSADLNKIVILAYLRNTEEPSVNILKYEILRQCHVE
jgi:hypothetical protein